MSKSKINFRTRSYLMVDSGGEEVILEGPFYPDDMDNLEDTLVMFLSLHKWNDEPIYRILTIDERGVPTVDELTEDHMAGLMREAWLGKETS